MLSSAILSLDLITISKLAKPLEEPDESLSFLAPLLAVTEYSVATSKTVESTESMQS